MMPAAGAQRRHGAALEADLLAAAWAELAEVGYARLTMEGVAARAGTGKQVLYRRWRNRADLVIAATRHHGSGPLVDNIPDTGTLRGDVLAVLRRMVRRQHEVGSATIHGLLAEATTLPPDFLSIADRVMRVILERAERRGECVPADLPARVVTLPTDLLRHELLLTDRPVPERTLTEIVDEVFLPLVRAVSEIG